MQFLFSFGAFRTYQVLILYVDCNEQALHYVREKLLLDLFYRILSHHSHPLNTYISNTKNDIFYQDRPSCVPRFDPRMRNRFDNSPVFTIEVIPYPLQMTSQWKPHDRVCSMVLMNLIRTVSIPLSFNNCLQHIV